MRALGFEKIFNMAAIILGCMSPALATNGGAASDQTLILEQRHCLYNTFTVYLNKSSLLVQLPSRRIELFAKGPQWKVICRNSSRHQYSITPYDVWITNGPTFSVSRAQRKLDQWNSIKAGPETYKNLPVTRYVFPRKYKDSGKPAPLSVGNEGYALVYQGPESSDKAGKILDALMERWNTPGIQLRTYRTNAQVYVPYRIHVQDRTPDLVTTLKWSRTKARPIFDLKGYKPAVKDTEIWYSEEEKEMIQDFGGQ